MGYFLRVRDWDGSYRGYYRFEENWFFFFFFFFWLNEKNVFGSKRKICH